MQKIQKMQTNTNKYKQIQTNTKDEWEQRGGATDQRRAEVKWSPQFWLRCQQCALSSTVGFKLNTDKNTNTNTIRCASVQKKYKHKWLPQNFNQSQKAVCALIRLIFIQIHKIYKNINTNIYNSYTSKQYAEKISFLCVTDTKMVGLLVSLHLSRQNKQRGCLYVSHLSTK